jgi:hypothetical protein
MAIEDSLEEYVFARNNLRSAENAAAGLISGKAVFSLKEARKREAMALRALAEWVEEQARLKLKLAPIPITRQI